MKSSVICLSKQLLLLFLLQIVGYVCSEMVLSQDMPGGDKCPWFQSKHSCFDEDLSKPNQNQILQSDQGYVH